MIMNHKLFRSVKYYVPETVPQERRSEITHVIESNGGERAHTIQSATHIITNSYRFQGWQDVPDAVKIVTDLWVDRTMILGQLLPCESYSANPGMIFSGLVGCGSGISAADRPAVEAGITALGGQWRNGLTKDVTHLFATSADSDMYAIAMKYQETTHIKVLLPHWFDDALRLGSANLSTLPYEWPDPRVLHPPPTQEEGKKEKAERSSRKLSAAKRALYKTAIWDSDKGGPFPASAEPAAEEEVWGGRKILLSPSLGLDGDARRVLEDAVETAGGLILYYASDREDGQEDEEFERVSECDVLVTRWRAGRAFFKATEDGKIVGTINWVFYVHATGVLSSPMDQLLHYPVRRLALENFSTHQITVTNYTGEARDYLKRLIHVMGATFTPNMTGSNTVLIAAHMGGVKTEKALSWNIPVVNHVWLEDCFVSWRSATPAVTKYLDFPPNVDFAPMLAERGFTFTVEDLGAEEDEDINARAQSSSERPPVGTEASAREVEGILGDGDVIMEDQDAMETEECRTPQTRAKSASGTRRVPASVSPAKQTVIDEEDAMDVDRGSKAPKSSNRAKLPASGDASEGASVAKPPAKRGKQPQRDTEPAVPVGKSTQRKGKERQLETEDEEAPEIPAARTKPKGKAKTGSRVMFAPETEPESAGPSNNRASKQPIASTSKRKAQLMESASNDEETQSDSPAPKKRAKSDKSASSTSAPANGAPSSGKRKMTAGPGRDSAPRKPERTESLRAIADERVSPAKSGSKPQGAGTSSNAGKSARNSTGGGKKTRDETDDESEEVMPDVVNYELEGRSHRSRASAGKRREEVDSADEMPPPQATKTAKATKAKTKKESTKKDSLKKDTSNTHSGSRGSRKGTIKMMTTTVTLSDSVQKALSKLGVKTASQISECTHLVAPGLVRTEKLLCAIATGAFILSDKWAKESAAANKLLPEDDYILRDKENERKWNFRLVDAMARAKENGGKLFENKTFYVTSKVPTDTKLLKTVVSMQGGKIVLQSPTIRILNSAPNRYIISCREDIGIWRSLTKDHAIYTQELLLTAAMTQEIDWDNPSFRLE